MFAVERKVLLEDHQVLVVRPLAPDNGREGDIADVAVVKEGMAQVGLIEERIGVGAEARKSKDWAGFKLVVRTEPRLAKACRGKKLGSGKVGSFVELSY